VARWFGTNTDVHDLKEYRDERERLLEEAQQSRERATSLSTQLAEERDKLQASNQMLTVTNADLVSVSQKLRQEQNSQARVTHYLRAANRAVAEISVAATTGEMTEILLALLVRTFMAKCVGIWHLDLTQNYLLNLVACHQLSGESLMVAPQLDVRYNSYKLCWVARYGKPFAGKVSDGDLQFDDAWLKSNHIGYIAIHPIISKLKVIGIMAYFGESELQAAAFEVLSTVSAVYASHLETLNAEGSSG